MLIDWFTVGAQLVNFLVLVWLMKRFLYKPILNAIDAREKRIAAELRDAAAQQSEAQKERDEFQSRNDDFERQRASLLSQATEEVKAHRQKLLEEARDDADAWLAKRQEGLAREQQSLHDEITRRTQQEVFAIARKTLADLADAGLEERMSEVCICRLRELQGEEKEGFATALKASSQPAFVRSAFDLPEKQQAAIQRALNETFAADIRLRFETDPTVISGIELTANGHKVGWSIADYLRSLEQSVDELLEERAVLHVNSAEQHETQNK
ncbi:F0F1 ATP synthase subunit delta [Lignipirellula cremea]|uniref:ATP synthase subunit b n=1 Tax=Lignipirellula cremea TaxID=2528010 RepID=A0A518E4B5_9BACT|nr:F0F1 ATP synthase subunit delta [Lignipirellula cremea]QDU98927.1 ATP synthase subunit b [Lignipirellula cremea]